MTIAGAQAQALLLPPSFQKRIVKIIRPATGGRDQPPLQIRFIHHGLVLGFEGNDVMDARQQIIANQRVMGRQAAIMRLGQHIAELPAQVRVELLPRNIDNGRDKPFEPIPAQQDTDPGTFLKRQDFPRIDQKILNGYLKQLIPGVAFQDMGEGFFVVTVFGKPRHFQRLADLAPEIGDITGNTVIGGRGEQAGKAAFADHLPLLVEFLHTDIIQMHRPVHR